MGSCCQLARHNYLNSTVWLVANSAWHQLFGCSMHGQVPTSAVGLQNGRKSRDFGKVIFGLAGRARSARPAVKKLLLAQLQKFGVWVWSNKIIPSSWWTVTLNPTLWPLTLYSPPQHISALVLIQSLEWNRHRFCWPQPWQAASFLCPEDQREAHLWEVRSLASQNVLAKGQRQLGVTVVSGHIQSSA